MQWNGVESNGTERNEINWKLLGFIRTIAIHLYRIRVDANILGNIDRT